MYSRDTGIGNSREGGGEGGGRSVSAPALRRLKPNFPTGSPPPPIVPPTHPISYQRVTDWQAISTLIMISSRIPQITANFRTQNVAPRARHRAVPRPSACPLNKLLQLPNIRGGPVLLCSSVLPCAASSVTPTPKHQVSNLSIVTWGLNFSGASIRVRPPPARRRSLRRQPKNAGAALTAPFAHKGLHDAPRASGRAGPTGFPPPPPHLFLPFAPPLSLL